MDTIFTWYNIFGYLGIAIVVSFVVGKVIEWSMSDGDINDD